MTDDKRSKKRIYEREQPVQLRGTIAEGLTHVETGSDRRRRLQQLMKFHGSYMQDDRDVRGERSARRSSRRPICFMIRLRIPGGFVKAKQWIGSSTTSRCTYAQRHSLRLTTRETFQFHGVIKSNLKRTMQAIQRRLPRYARGVRRRQLATS